MIRPRLRFSFVVFNVCLLCLTAPTLHAQDQVQGYWDGRFGDPDFGGEGLSGRVQALAIHPITGEIYAGGEFLDAAGERVNRIARWTGTGWEGLGEGMNSIVYALAFDPAGNLYAGGSFTEVDGMEIGRGIALWDGQAWSPVGQGLADGRVNAFVVDEQSGDVYVGGDFDEVVNTDGTVVFAGGIARWTGTDWERLGYGGGTFSSFRALALDPITGDLFAAGLIGDMANPDSSLVPARDLVRWDGSTWTSLDETSTIFTINALTFDEAGTLYVGQNGVAGIARWDREAWDVPGGGMTGSPNHVNAIAIKGDRVFVGGNFTGAEQADGTPLDAKIVAVWNTTTEAWERLGEGAFNSVNPAAHAFVVKGDEVWVGGAIKEAGGRPSLNIARWFDVPPPYTAAYTTFRVDARRPAREGLFRFNTSRPMLEVFDGDATGRFYLYDFEKDSVWTVRIPQPTGQALPYAFAFDIDGNGYPEGGEDIIYELDGAAGAREVTLTGTNPTTLPVVLFDDRPVVTVDPDYEGLIRHDFDSGDPSPRVFDVGGTFTHTSVDFDQLDRGTDVAVRWYIKDPGAAAPEGIAVRASSTYWAVAQAPAQAVFVARFSFSYALVAGITAPEDLRILHRTEAAAPWTVRDTEVDLNEETLTAVGVTDLNGEWTIGSVTTANPLTPDPPGLVSAPLPTDGTLNAPVRPLLSWARAVAAQTYDVYLWPAGALEPTVPTQGNIGTLQYQTTSDLVLSQEYNWRVVAHNVNGTTPGPVWSFTVGTVPDLQVSAVQAPAEVFSGQTIEVDWTVTNAGDGGTSVPEWKDVLYLSQGAVFDVLTATELARVQNLSFLAPGESYANSRSITLPNGISGAYYLHVKADVSVQSGGVVHESDETNNVAPSDPVAVTLTPYADLEVVSVVAPGNVFSGDSVDVSWTVENVGDGQTNVGAWFDTVFLSDNDELEYVFLNHPPSIDIALDADLGTAGHDGLLQPGEQYTATTRVKLPDDAVGDYFVLAYADVAGGGQQPVDGEVYEFNQGLDNWASTPISITLTPPPDLVVTSVEPPVGIFSGQVIDLSWTVQNQGPGATRATQWRDLVYISNEPTFDTASAIVLGGFVHNGALANDESYTASGLVTVPDGFSGDTYFYVQSDWRGDVFEHDFEVNNRGVNAVPAPVVLSPYPDLEVAAVSLAPTSATAGQQAALTYTLSNTGVADAPSWADSVFASTSETWNRALAVPVEVLPVNDAFLLPQDELTRTVAVTIPPGLSGTYYFYVQADGAQRLFEYPDGEGNLARTGSVQVATYPPVDLVVSLTGVPAEAPSGEPLLVPVTVENQGTGRTRVAAWTDALYLSLDETLEPEVDVALGEFRHEGALSGGASYSPTRTVTPPNGLEGAYFLLAQVDRDAAAVDTDPSNNVFAQPITLVLPTPSDLEVTVLDAPAMLQAGQPLTVNWTVENTDAGVTARDHWFDAVYLSTDDKLNQGDRLLGTLERTGALEAGASYDGSLRVILPGYAAGAYYVMVQADTRDDTYEHLGEGNNITRSRLDVVLSPPTDLTVTNVVAPEAGVPGQELLVNWTLENIGDQPAQGLMREAVYLSTDAVWDAADALMGVSERELDLAPGGKAQLAMKTDLGRSYGIDEEGNLTAPLPGVLPGAYYAIVRTDLGNNIRETDTGNNTVASAGQVSAEVEVLALGTPLQATPQSGASRYYQVEVPTGGESIVFSVGTESGAEGHVELYVREGAAPSRSVHDASAREPFELNQQLTLASADAGTYYVLVQAEDVPEGETLDVEATVLDFEVREIDPPYGGNTGVVTTVLSGAKFEEGAEVFLRDGAGELHPAFETAVQNATEILARFNLDGQVEGARDVVVRNPGGGEAVLANGFDVVTGIGAQLYVETSFPESVRSCGTVAVEVTVGNRGTENANDLFLVFAAKGLSLKPPCGDGVAFFDTFPWALSIPQPTFLEVPRYFAEGDAAVMPIWFYEMAPGSETTFTVFVDHFVSEGTVSHIADLVPMPESEFTRTGALADIETAGGYQLIRDAVVDLYNELAADSQSSTGTAGKARQDANEGEKVIRESIADLALHQAPGTYTVAGAVIGTLLGAAIGFVAPAPTTTAIGAKIGFQIGLFAGGIADVIVLGNAAAEKCKVLYKDLTGSLDSGKRSNGGAANQHEGQPAGSCADGDTIVRAAFDPNDLTGPEGYGEDNWVSATRTLGYRIRFENDSTKATAPAQAVRINHPLDADVDERAFRLGDFGFGGFSFSPPENVSYYRERLDLADTLGILLDVTAGIDVLAREAFWIFRTIDPNTGAQPVHNPNVGFLAVNDANGSGQGFVDYTVRAAPGVQTGDVIDAAASIVFDINAPLETPPVFNTIDASVPVSKVNVLPFRQDTSAFQITWTSTDAGSGVAGATLFVSQDDGPFEPYQGAVDGNEVLFIAEKDHRYKFFTVAQDNVGNAEALKGEAEAATAVANEEVGAELPEQFALHQNYPNPFNPSTTIPFDVAERGEARIVVYDVLGRRVLTLMNESVAPGRYQRRLDLSNYASGVYFYEIRVTGPDGLRFRDVKSFILVK